MMPSEERMCVKIHNVNGNLEAECINHQTMMAGHLQAQWWRIGIPYIFVQRTHGDEDDDDDDNDKWRLMQRKLIQLTYWGRVTHICVGKQTIIVSDNGLSPGRRQAIIWTNAGILLIGPLGTNFSEILIGIQTFSFKKMSSAKWRPFVSASNVLSLLKAMGKTCRVTLTETQHKNKLSRN